MYKSLVLIVAILIICFPAFAQTGVWKKTVSRTIDVAEKEDTATHHLTDVTNDTSLFEIMAVALKAGKLTAYNSFDHDFTTKITATQLKELLGGKTDTTQVTDPVIGKDKWIIVHHDFPYSMVHKFRLLEEWTFDPRTGKTDVQITGISPMRDVYGDNGVFRGKQSIFWVKYADAHDVIAKYDARHPTRTFASLIWDDYFLSDVKPQVVK